jgi:glucokinase
MSLLLGQEVVIGKSYREGSFYHDSLTLLAMAKTRSSSPSTQGARPVLRLTQTDACEVLQQLRARDFDSRALLGRHCGLSPSRLSAAISLLVRNGLVERASLGRSAAGGRSSGLRLNPGYGHVIAVDIGGSNLRVALADMRGTVLGKWSASTKRTSSPDMVIEQILQGVQFLLQQTSVARRSLLAVAAGAPGVTHANSGIVVATSYLKGWKNVPFGTLLESALRIPAAVENDVRLAAIGENWAGAARGVRDFVFLAIGTGIAAGIFANGKLVHGTDWTAGEVGYMHVPGTPEEAAKRGAPGSLESTIGGEGIRRQWLSSREGTSIPLVKDCNATEILELGRSGDVHAASVLNRSARVLAYAVYNISLVLNSALFVLGGGVGMSAPLLEATRRCLKQYNDPVRPKLILSSLGQDAQLTGAIRLALDKAESRIGLRI